MLQCSTTQDVRSQRQEVRIALKELESLSFDMEDANSLRSLLDLRVKYNKDLHTEEGLILRPQPTSTTERARKLKLKYKRLQQRAVPYGSLESKLQPGRPRADERYRNRVGRRAANFRKVWLNVHEKYVHVHLDCTPFVCTPHRDYRRPRLTGLIERHLRKHNQREVSH